MRVGVTPKRESLVRRMSAWQLAAIPFVAGLAVRVLVVVIVQILMRTFFSSTIRVMTRLDGRLLRHGTCIFPFPASVAVTNSYLYYVFVAAVYFAFGRHWILVKLIAALLSALSVPAAAAIGSSRWAAVVSALERVARSPVSERDLLGNDRP